jgi:hypothetical protein
MYRFALTLSFLVVFAAGLAFGQSVADRLTPAEATAAPVGHTPRFGDISTQEGVLKVNEIEFNQQATGFLSHKGNSLTPIEHLLAIVQLEALFPYDSRDMPGCDITYYADRFIGARYLLTSHLLRGTSTEHQDKVRRLHELLGRVNAAESVYQSLFVGGTGAYRNRRVEHMEVEKALSRWALRLSTGKHPANLTAAVNFKALRDKLGQNDENHSHLCAEQVDGYRKETRVQRDQLIRLIDELALELTTWPPEASKELATLILRTF